MTRSYGLFAAIVLALCARAQDPQRTNVKGTLHSDSESVLRGFVIELDAVSARGDTWRADVQGNGNFELRDVPYGDYTVRITTFQGEPVAQQLVSIHDRTAPLELYLPSRPAEPTGGTVSMNELRHPPAPKAVEAAIAAQHFSQEGRSAEAAGALEKAVPISPDFAVAHSNLAVQYLRMRRFKEARDEIQRSMEIAGPNPRDLSNLAYTLVQLERLPEAAESARQALAIDRNCAPAQYMLGAILAINPQTRAEGIAHLEVAAKTMDSARKALIQLGD
jgi:tetratricopeptide (TPR) repeat protein